MKFEIFDDKHSFHRSSSDKNVHIYNFCSFKGNTLISGTYCMRKWTSALQLIGRCPSKLIEVF